MEASPVHSERRHSSLDTFESWVSGAFVSLANTAQKRPACLDLYHGRGRRGLLGTKEPRRYSPVGDAFFGVNSPRGHASLYRPASSPPSQRLIEAQPSVEIFSCQATTTPTSADVLPSRIETGGVRGIDGRSRARLLCASNLSLSSTPPPLIALRKTRNPPWRKPYTAILGPVWIFHETGHDRTAPRPALLHPRVPCLVPHGPYSPNLSPSPPSILVSGMEGPTCQPFRPCSGLGDGEYIYIMSTRLGDAQLCPARVSPQQRLL